MDRSWINLRDQACSEYSDGVANFCTIATNHLDEEGRIRCSCSNYVNVNWNRLDVVECHLYKYGMSRLIDDGHSMEIQLVFLHF